MSRRWIAGPGPSSLPPISSPNTPKEIVETGQRALCEMLLEQRRALTQRNLRGGAPQVTELGPGLVWSASIGTADGA